MCDSPYVCKERNRGRRQTVREACAVPLGLCGEHVDGGAGERAAAQRGRQRANVHHRPARVVDQVRACAGGSGRGRLRRPARPGAPSHAAYNKAQLAALPLMQPPLCSAAAAVRINHLPRTLCPDAQIRLAQGDSPELLLNRWGSQCAALTAGAQHRPPGWNSPPAPRRMAASSLAPIIFRVAGVAGTCSVTKSDCSSASASVLHAVALPIDICARRAGGRGRRATRSWLHCSSSGVHALGRSLAHARVLKPESAIQHGQEAV